MENFVFDLYGTLVDIRTDEYSESFKTKYLKYLKRFKVSGNFFENFNAALSAFSAFDEPDIVQVIRSAVKDSGGSMPQREAEAAALKFRRLSTRKLKLYRGVKALLKGLKAHGAKIYLLSNAQAAFTVYELKKLGIYAVFDGIELSSDFGKRKPSPQFFAHLIEKYSLDVSKTVFTGNDIKCDVIAAKEAGMTPVYIKTAISPADDDIIDAQKIASFASDSVKSVYDHLLNIAK